jgi:hypothetical protein
MGENNKWDMDGKRKGKEAGAAKHWGLCPCFHVFMFFEYFLGAKLVALRLMPFCFLFLFSAFRREYVGREADVPKPHACM